MSKTHEKSRMTHSFVVGTVGKQIKVNPKVKTLTSEEVIYVLQIGEYHRTQNILATTDAKRVAKEYVKHIQPEFNSPLIEVWKNEEIIGYFCENEKFESKVKKAITKIAMGLNK